MPQKAAQAEAMLVKVELPASILEDKMANISLKPTEVAQHLTLLRGFRDLMAERMGYVLGRRLTQQDMSEKTEAERKKVSEIRKEITEKLETYIKDADLQTYQARQKALKDAREVLKKASEPFRTKITPLAKAQRYLDNVAIPDALKELGTPVQPRFSLSKWIETAIESSKKKK